MSTIDNGGPAFPSKKRVYRAGYETNEFEPVGGMTLRDYFAAKAMQGMMAGNWNTNYDDWAKHAYILADAMIKARKLAK